MTKDGFRRYLQPYIDQKRAFSAYWHPHGFGLILTGPRPTYKTRYVVSNPGKPDKAYSSRKDAYNACDRLLDAGCRADVSEIQVPGKPQQLSEAKLAKWRKNIDWLRARTEVITVDYDGVGIKTEGGIEL